MNGKMSAMVEIQLPVPEDRVNLRGSSLELQRIP